MLLSHSFLPLFSYWFLELFSWTFPQGYTGLQVLFPRSPLEGRLTCYLVMLRWRAGHTSITLAGHSGPGHVLLPDLSLGAWTPTAQTYISACLGLQLLSPGT